MTLEKVGVVDMIDRLSGSSLSVLLLPVLSFRVLRDMMYRALFSARESYCIDDVLGGLDKHSSPLQKEMAGYVLWYSSEQSLYAENWIL